MATKTKFKVKRIPKLRLLLQLLNACEERRSGGVDDEGVGGG